MKKVSRRPLLNWFYLKLLKSHVGSELVPLTWTQLVNMVLIRVACRASGYLPEIIRSLFWTTMDESYKIQLVSWHSRGYSDIPALVECPQPNYLIQGHPLNQSALERFPEPEIRRAVAANPNTPTVVLAVLACDPDKEVRLIVAKSQFATPEVLNYLAADELLEVRLAVAENPKTEWRTLLNLVLVKHRRPAA